MANQFEIIASSKDGAVARDRILSEIKPPFHRGGFFLAHDDLTIRIAFQVDTHLDKEPVGQLFNGDGGDDKLTIDAHEALRIQFLFDLVQRHGQKKRFSLQRIEPNHSVLDGNMTHIRGRDKMKVDRY